MIHNLRRLLRADYTFGTKRKIFQPPQPLSMLLIRTKWSKNGIMVVSFFKLWISEHSKTMSLVRTFYGGVLVSYQDRTLLIFKVFVYLWLLWLHERNIQTYSWLLSTCQWEPEVTSRVQTRQLASWHLCRSFVRSRVSLPELEVTLDTWHCYCKLLLTLDFYHESMHGIIIVSISYHII